MTNRICLSGRGRNMQINVIGFQKIGKNIIAMKQNLGQNMI